MASTHNGVSSLGKRSTSRGFPEEERANKKVKVAVNEQLVGLVARPPAKKEPSDEVATTSSGKKRRSKKDLFESFPSRLDSDIYTPLTSYFDLGYVSQSLEIAGVPTHHWRTKCCSFSFMLKPDEYSMADLEKLSTVSHFRIVCADVHGESMILLPPSVISNLDLPLLFKGCVKFRNGDLDYIDFTKGFLDALRHYAAVPLEGSLEKVQLPQLPVRVDGSKFLRGGEEFQLTVMPKLFGILSGSQQLHFVRRVEENAQVSEEIVVDVYLTEGFFETEKYCSYQEAAENHHDIKNSLRLRLLLDSGKKITVQGNHFLYTLLEEKGYKPVQRDVTKKVFGDHIDPKSLSKLFTYVRDAHADQSISVDRNPQHRSLILKMHGYQKRAVTWMLSKELLISSKLTVSHPLYFSYETFGGDRLFMHGSSGRVTKECPKIPAACGGILADEMGLGKTLEILSLTLCNPSPYTIPRQPPSFKDIEQKLENNGVHHCYCHNPEDPLPTISCFSCGTTYHKDCINHKLIPKSVPFLCHTCQRHHKIDCKTTIVIAPAAIIPQWEAEIKKSARGLNVYRYKGIPDGYVSPWELASKDIVLASYEMLSQELLYLWAEERKATLRRLAKRIIVPCPLLAIKFWRLVLDEAQMVESQTANYARMAMMISANCYWAVTGTPIQNSVSDLQALFSFIELAPWQYERWFDEYLSGPFKAGIPNPLQDVLADCMWRLEKRDVENEMDLPPCATVVHSIRFSGIEMQLYQQVYRDCIKVVTGKLKGKRFKPASYNKTISELDWDLVKIIKLWMGHLEKLCTSPTRVKYYFTEPRKKKDVDPNDVTDSLGRVVNVLLDKARLSFQGSLRTCIMHCVAIAGYHWLMDDPVDAAEKYREAKRIWTENEQYVPVDIGQKLHILTNLGELLAEYRTLIRATLEDDQLLDQANALRTEFMARMAGSRNADIQRTRECWSNFPHGQKDFERTMKPVIQALNLAQRKKDAEGSKSVTELIRNCKMVSQTGMDWTASRNNFKSVRSRALSLAYDSCDGLKFVLVGRWKEIIEERDVLLKKVDDLIKRSGEEDQFFQECADCHLRSGHTLKKCQLCTIEKAFSAYQDMLFRSVVSVVEEDEDHLVQRTMSTRPNRKIKLDAEDDRDEAWSESDFELVCKALFHFIKTTKEKNVHLYDYDAIDGEVKGFFRMLDQIKKEYKLWRSLWITLYNLGASNDEIRQAVMRVSFATEEDLKMAKSVKTKEKQFMDHHALINPSTPLPPKLESHRHGLKTATLSLNTECTRFKYIRNMHEGYMNESNVEKRDCCVCLEAVAQNWALFPCAHVVCRDCLAMMATQAPLTPGHSSKHSCPLCRTAASSREILQPGNIKRTPSPLKSHRFSGLFLRGAPSKMEAVVRSVSKLFDEDPETKILIFSDYGDVLQDYHAILKRNGFEAVHAANKTKIPENIQKLRDGKASILLMPISFGGKGLTIIEANHLFFLEPLLNKGAELQAIGRIYRMGQQKPTFVHKFIVEQTIEEQIHTMMSSVGQEGNLLEENLTLRQVLSLLKSSGAHGPDLDDGDFWTNLQSGTEPSTSQGITSPSDAGPSTSAM